MNKEHEREAAAAAWREMNKAEPLLMAAASGNDGYLAHVAFVAGWLAKAEKMATEGGEYDFNVSGTSELSPRRTKTRWLEVFCWPATPRQ